MGRLDELYCGCSVKGEIAIYMTLSAIGLIYRIHQHFTLRKPDTIFAFSLAEGIFLMIPSVYAVMVTIELTTTQSISFNDTGSQLFRIAVMLVQFGNAFTYLAEVIMRKRRI